MDIKKIKATHRENVGNCLISTENFNSGDILWTEEPIIVGPNHLNLEVCLNCLNVISDSEIEICSSCQWTLCENCRQQKSRIWHDQFECDILSKSKVDTKFYQLIFPMRLLREAINCTEKWQALKNLMDHYSALENNEDFKIIREKVTGLPWDISVSHNFVCFHFLVQGPR